MSVIALPRNRVWTQQPPASLVPNHAIGRVRFLVGGSDRLRDAISGKVADYGTNPYGYGVNKNGRQGKFDYSGAGTYTGVTLPGDKPLIVTWTEQTSATSGYMGVANLGFGGANPCAIFQAFSDSGYSFSLGVIGSDSAVFATIGAPVTGVPTTYSAVFPKGLNSGTKSEVVVFKNGQRHVPTGTAYFGASTLNDRIVLGGMQGYHYYGLLGNFSVVEGSSEVLARELSLNPFLAFAPQSAPLFVPVSAGGGSASGSFSPVSVTPQTASASGSASATGACAAITITAPTATASAGGSASASGSFAALSISPATATATATKSATASGAFATISLSAPTGTATGTSAGNAIATGTPAQITISQAAAIAIGSAVASGGFQSIGITAPSATASVGNGNATATGAWASVSITAPAAYASSGFIRAPAGSGPTVIQPGGYRPSQSATSRPSNTGGRRY